MKQLELMTTPASNLNPTTKIMGAKIMSNKKVFNSLGWLICASCLLVSFSVYAGTASKKVTYVDKIEDIEKMHINKMMDMEVVNNNGEKLGKISNLILSPKPESVLFAIMSVGGFLGIDAKLVAVPVDNLTFKNNKATLDATKQEINEAPEFNYTPSGVPDIANPPE